jgi:hypothetical protein
MPGRFMEIEANACTGEGARAYIAMYFSYCS